jgi:hypothetical protein
MTKIVTFIIILFSAVAFFFILYPATGNTASLIFANPQLGTYLGKLNVNPYNQDLACPYSVNVFPITGIFQYEITYTSSDII